MTTQESGIDTGRDTRRAGMLFMAVTILGWGLNWPLMKGLLRDWPPLSARGWAGLAGALTLALIAHLRGESLAVPPRVIGPLLLAALFNVTAWMGISTLGMVSLSVAEAAMLVYTMPIWVMLFAWPLLGERPTAGSLLALIMGFGGIVVLLGNPSFTAGSGKLVGVAFSLTAAILFAFGVVRTRTPLNLPPIASVAWQVGLGCLPMAAYGLLVERPDIRALTAADWASMAYMAAVPMALCYLTWFMALQRLPASTASMASLLTPVIGVFAAALIFGSPVGPRELLAMALILAGVAVALRRRPPAPAAKGR